MSPTPPARLTVATAQFEPVPGDKEANLHTLRRLWEQAGRAGAQLVVLPEMCTLGYWHLHRRSRAELEAWAEPRTGPTVTHLSELATGSGIGVGAGFLEREGHDLYNSWALCLPDGAVHVHRKLHAFEHEAISSGDTYTVFDTPWGVRTAVLTCWDNNLVENVRMVALKGAEVLLAPHQTGGTRSVSPGGMRPVPWHLWENREADPEALERAYAGEHGRGWVMRWLPARAHDNGLFVVFSNGVGRDDDELRTGHSMILDPYGSVLAEVRGTGEGWAAAELDTAAIPLSTGRRWIRGRRPELYADLARPTGHEVDPRTARFSPERTAGGDLTA